MTGHPFLSRSKRGCAYDSCPAAYADDNREQKFGGCAYEGQSQVAPTG
jgi:hypothetical protein